MAATVAANRNTLIRYSVAVVLSSLDRIRLQSAVILFLNPVGSYSGLEMQSR